MSVLERLKSSQAAEYIDLHAHTDESDGSLSPAGLVSLARRADLAALAITDHDTFAGFEKAAPHAQAAGLDLIRGIELNTRLYLEGQKSHRSLHLLAYFVKADPSNEFTAWLEHERCERRERNLLLTKTLQARGVDVTLEEVEARGRSLAGRPHFARILVEKGYAKSSDEAFQRYLGEEAPTFVPRKSKTTEEAIQIVRQAGGIPSIAHPIRLGFSRTAEQELLIHFKRVGLLGLEVYHSEHSPTMQAHYRQLAKELQLLPTGGSDFHGTIKPEIDLGTGMNGNVRVPISFLQEMRAFANAA